jgi:chitinase
MLLIFLFTLLSAQLRAQTDVWATAYYAGWMQGWNNNGHLTAEEIDYSAVTHIVHFALVPKADGTLNADANSILEINSSELITRAHAEGKKVLISIGGWNSNVGFRGAASSINLPIFVNNLVNFMISRGYDGIDIDWEPLHSSDAILYTALITALRTALDAITPKPLLTAAVGWEPEIIAQVHQHFDQINIMTYDFSGAWPGWVTWHNSPVYDGGFLFPSTNNAPPSANDRIDRFLAAGVPAGKLGIGIDFYGYVWSGGSGTSTDGVTKPRQTWTTAPSVQGNVPYYTIMEEYYQPQYYMWDDGPKGAYLSIDNSGAANDKFISYDDESSVQAKFNYARSKGIGGLIIWELGGGYRPNQPEGERDILLQSVKTALYGGATSNNENNGGIPMQFTLKQNYPNPFNPTTTIEFSLATGVHVQLEIYNMIGEKIATLINENLNAGVHKVTWDASGMSSGTYVYQLRSGEHLISKKMIMLK